MAQKKNIKTKQKKPRVIKQGEYKSFRLSKRIKPVAVKPLPSIYKICKLALVPIKNNRRLFIGIILLQFVFTVILVSGFGALFDFLNLKNNLEQTFGGNLSNAGTAVTLFSYAISTGGGADALSANYQLMITLLVSLALIWSIRQVMAGEKVGVRQAFYRGMYPLIPFVTVLFVIVLQLIPLMIGNFLLSIVINNGLAITFLEKSLWWLIFILLALLSFYMILSSIFGLYISALPDMTPMKALRSARGLVLHRRLSVAIRLAALPIVVGIIYAIVLIPLILILPVLVIPVFFLLNGFSLYFVHSYLYNLYRALL